MKQAVEIKSLGKLALALTLAIFFSGCAKERPVKEILSNGKRLSKKVFDGTYLYQKTVTDMKYAGKANSDLPIGYHLESEKLVQFVLREKTLDIVSIDPLFQDERAALKSTLLASFPIRHVDVLRKQNADLKDTHEVEETETRNAWEQRGYVVVDPTGDTQDSIAREAKAASTPDSIEVDASGKSINVDVTYFLKDDTKQTRRYSFLKYEPSSTYQQKEYPKELQLRFGYFATSTQGFDKYGRITQSDRKIFINRWDTSKKIIYYLSKGFPEHLKNPTRQVFAKWNDAFKAAVGRDVLEVRDNSGQEIGDLRYSMIIYDPTVDASHGILGYGPSVGNPRTGEIVKADVMLYGGVLKSAVFREKRWASLLGDFNPIPSAPPSVVPATPVPAQVTFSGVAGTGLVPGVGYLSAFQLLENGLETKTDSQSRPVIASLVKETQLDIGDIEKRKTLHLDLFKKEHSGLSKVATHIDEGALSAVKDAVANQLSEQDTEIAIFIPLLAHELGHTFNLRHNFMGSFDGKHFEGEEKSSSVMDYIYLTSHEPVGPAQYDRAAIQMAYGNDDVKAQQLLAENYYFCTDEHATNPQDMSCNRFDAGVTLSKITESMARRYTASWFFNNFRMDRVHFGGTLEDSKEYRAKILKMLLPIRFMYDNAHAIVSSQSDASRLWRLTHQRIEADTNTKADDVVEIEVPTQILIVDTEQGMSIKPQKIVRRLDKSKMAAIVKDATETKKSAISALASILFDRNRPEYGVPNLIDREIEVRGTLQDKLYALLMIGSAFPNPIGDGTTITVYNTFGNPFPRMLLVSLLGNVAALEKAEGFRGYDVNLREMAFELLAKELATSAASPLARELVAVEKVKTLDKTDADFVKVNALRSEIRSLMKKLMSGSLTEDEGKTVAEKMAELEKKRSQNTGYAIAGDLQNGYYRAAVQIPKVGHDTATGHMIQDNMNHWEDVADAATELRAEIMAEAEAEMAKPKAPKDVKPEDAAKYQDESKAAMLMVKVNFQVPQLTKMIEKTTEMQSVHATYLEKFYQYYTYGKVPE